MVSSCGWNSCAVALGTAGKTSAATIRAAVEKTIAVTKLLFIYRKNAPALFNAVKGTDRKNAGGKVAGSF
jgi:hypothetical protein